MRGAVGGWLEWSCDRAGGQDPIEAIETEFIKTEFIKTKCIKTITRPLSFDIGTDIPAPGVTQGVHCGHPVSSRQG